MAAAAADPLPAAPGAPAAAAATGEQENGQGQGQEQQVEVVHVSQALGDGFALRAQVIVMDQSAFVWMDVHRAELGMPPPAEADGDVKAGGDGGVAEGRVSAAETVIAAANDAGGSAKRSKHARMNTLSVCMMTRFEEEAITSTLVGEENPVVTSVGAHIARSLGIPCFASGSVAPDADEAVPAAIAFFVDLLRPRLARKPATGAAEEAKENNSDPSR